MVPVIVIPLVAVIGAALGAVATMAYIVTDHKDGDGAQRRYDQQRDEQKE